MFSDELDVHGPDLVCVLLLGHHPYGLNFAAECFCFRSAVQFPLVLIR